VEINRPDRHQQAQCLRPPPAACHCWTARAASIGLAAIGHLRVRGASTRSRRSRRSGTSPTSASGARAEFSRPRAPTCWRSLSSPRLAAAVSGSPARCVLHRISAERGLRDRVCARSFTFIESPALRLRGRSAHALGSTRTDSARHSAPAGATRDSPRTDARASCA